MSSVPAPHKPSVNPEVLNHYLSQLDDIEFSTEHLREVARESVVDMLEWKAANTCRDYVAGTGDHCGCQL